MSADDVLFQDRYTTSVYDKHPLNLENRAVATLNEFNPTYTTIPELRAEDAPKPEKVIAAVNKPQIVVQLRKRLGEVQLFIDGLHSVGTQRVDDGVFVHTLNWHKGLHFDNNTRTRIFSPLAFVAAVEDGQHSLESVTIGLLQVSEDRGEQVGDTILLGETNLVPHRVSDVRCNVVRSPYPLTYSPQAKVRIMDNSKRLSKTWVSSFKSICEVNKLTLPIILKFVAGMKGHVGVQVWAFMAMNAAVQAFLTCAKESKTVQNVVVAGFKGTTGGIVWSAVEEWITKDPDVEDSPVSMTLNEFSETLEVLTIRRNLGQLISREPYKKENEERDVHAKRERVMWNWLLDDKNPKIDLTHMIITRISTVTTRINISIDDQMSCNPGVQYHEICCQREDRCELAAAASGAIDDILRARQAIIAFCKLVDDFTSSDKANELTWYDYHVENSTVASSWVTVIRSRIEKASNFDFKSFFNTKSLLVQINQLSKADIGKRFDQFVKIKKNLRIKLKRPFFESGGIVDNVLDQMKKALDDTGIPEVPKSVFSVRKLPQRVRAVNSRVLFVAGTQPEGGINHSSEALVNGIFVRQQSAYESSIKMMTETMRQGSIAIVRLVPQWESSIISQVALECLCENIGSHKPDEERDDLWNLKLLRSANCYSTLVLCTPVDVQFATATVSIPEHTMSRLRLVTRRSHQNCEKSILEVMGLRNTNADLLACQIFGDLWIDELVEMHKSDQVQVQMLETASSRAAKRLSAAGDHLLKLVGGSIAMENEYSAGENATPNRADISLVATQPGRDAGLILDRVLFKQEYANVHWEMAKLVRNCAHTAVRAASEFERSVPTRLPHEPTQSLFGYRNDGVVAFLRSKKLMTKDWVVNTITSAYPSTLLLEADCTFTDNDVSEMNNRTPEQRTFVGKGNSQEIVASMRFRMAGLRTDPSSAIKNISAKESQLVDIDEVSKQLCALELNGDFITFYVPFGFGDATPAPTFPPFAAPLFGTVPVFCKDLKLAFETLEGFRVEESSDHENSDRAITIDLRPTIGCVNDPLLREVESVHPNMILVKSNDGGKSICATYLASSAPALKRDTHTKDAKYTNDTNHENIATKVKEAACHNKRNQWSADVASSVSSFSWNVERVVQAVMASLSCCKDRAEFDTIVLTFNMPHGGTGRSFDNFARPFFLKTQQSRFDRNVTQLVEYLDKLVENIFQKISDAFDAYCVMKAPGENTLAFTLKKIDKSMTWGEWVKFKEIKEFDTPIATRDRVLPGAQTPMTFLQWLETEYWKQNRIFEMIEDIYGIEKELQNLLGDKRAQLRTSTNQKVRDAGERFQFNVLPTTTEDSAPDSRLALVGALGVAMAMLYPLLPGITIDVKLQLTTDGQQEKVVNLSNEMKKVAKNFSNYKAVRFSEACFVVLTTLEVG